MSADPSFPNFNDQKTSSIGLASPRDRLAALILDVTLLLPLIQFFQAPVKKWILESLLFYKGTSAPLYELVNILILCLLFIIYFSFSTYLFGQSIGKLFFKIKVISYHGKLSLYSSFLRSVFIVFEFMCLGVPFLALFSHSLRRALHDRVSDTIVISFHNPVGFPQVSWKWKVAVTSAVTFCLLLMSVIFYNSMDNEIDLGDSLLVFDKSRCDLQFSKVDESLSSMIELYLVKKISSECLFDKGRENLWKNENKSLAQFAMALSYEEDSMQSDRYLKSICDTNSDDTICELSLWLLSESRLNQGDQLFEIALKKNQENFVKIFAAAYFNSFGEYNKVVELLSMIKDKKQLEPLLASLSFQSYLGQFKLNEAMALYKTHASLNENNVTDFIRFAMEHQGLTINQQIHIIESFFPQIVKSKQDRGLASSDEVSHEISELYQILKGAL